MKGQMQPLTLGRLEEGRALSEFDARLIGLARALCAHADHYGSEAKGVKASISLTVELTATDPDNALFGVKTKMTTKEPGRPLRSTIAMVDEDESGQLGLFVRGAGSSSTTPRQMILATADGRAVDLETQEVVIEATGERLNTRTGEVLPAKASTVQADHKEIG